MYKLLLTFRYLRRKLIPVFALLTVVLCVAMVIIVISIMGGFLDLVKNAGRTLMGDVSIYSGYSGFPHYEKAIDAIVKLPEAEAATPIVVAYGLLKIGEVTKPVQVFGIEGEGQDRVTSYRKTLYWTKERLAEMRHRDVRGAYEGHDPVAAAVSMRAPWPEAKEGNWPAIVMGIEVSPANYRTDDGSYTFAPAILRIPLVLTVLPVTAKGGALEPATERVIPVNEFNSGVFDVDAQRVFIPFDVAQRMMSMNATQRVARNPDGTPALNPDGTVKTEGATPARATEVHIRAAKGVSADALREAVSRQIRAMEDTYPELGMMRVETWQERQAKFLSAVENEKGLMTFLFGIISVTAVVMIGVVFYMIVLEKTRDIGILRAVGASSAGVASIFLSFGAVIGTLGAAAGVTIAYLVVVYINEIHAWLGDTTAALLGEQNRVVIWDRSVYFFDRIPNRIDWNEVAVIAAVAIVASIFGALVPAFKAARVDPIQSLRYE